MTRSAVQNMTNQELYKILMDIDTSDLFGNDVTSEEAVEKINAMSREEQEELYFDFLEFNDMLEEEK